MFKLGVRRADQLPRVHTLLGRRKCVSIAVYAEILRERPDADPWLPLVLETQVVGEHAFKRTYDRRFPELDAVLVALARELRPAAGAPLSVHDMGVSDGRTCVELYRALRALGPLDFTASDAYGVLWNVRQRRGWSVAFDQETRPVEYAGWGFVLSPLHPDRAALYPLNRGLAAWFRRRRVPRAARALAAVDREALPDFEPVAQDDFEITKIPVVCRACRELSRSEPAFRFERHDVRQRTRRPHDLIRAMNVLNHLGAEDRRRALDALRESLREGGLLAVGRSRDRFDEGGGESATSIWRREGSRLALVREIGGGAEVRVAGEALAPSGCAPEAAQT